MPFKPGDQVGPYQIIEQLGQGGMATVFKAYHPALDRYVAIKGMHKVLTQDPNFQARFQREAQVVARLEHPNIVPVYDFAEHEGDPYLVMKLVEGRTLKHRLKDGPLSREELDVIVGAVGAGLAAAHEREVLHRDIKPSNVILGDDGKVYLTDFGLARIASAGESTLSADVMLGTPQYISPEQALGADDLDDGTDIYSFGVMLYELVVGQVPFNSDTPFSIVHDHIYTPLPLPRVRNDDVPEAVERVLLKALAKSRADRYESVNVLVESFLAAFDGQVDPSLPFLDPVSAVLEPLESASTAQPVVALPSESGSLPVSTPQKAPKSRRKWLLLGIPAVFIFCVCAFLLLSALGAEDGNDSPADAAAEATETSEVLDTPTEPDTDVAPTEPASDAPDNAQSAIDRAIAEVEARPDDPYAHLALAQAYWEAGRVEDAGGAIEHAFELGSDEPDFYVELGDFFFERELWFEAVESYLVAAQLNDNAVPLPVRARMERAIYNAALDARVEESALLGRDIQIRGIDAVLLMVARARRLLYSGQASAAREILVTVFEQRPDYTPGLLLEAELLFLSGEREAARTLLNSLTADDIDPAWVALQARALMFDLDQVDP